MKKVINFLIIATIFTPVPTLADQLPFDNLKVIEVDRVFATDQEPFDVRVHYEPTHTEVVNKRHDIEADDHSIEVLKTKLDGKEFATIYYSPGESTDPSFKIINTKSGKLLGEFGGLELFIPGNGSIYVMGYANNCFNEHRKFTLKSDKFIEVKQPFYYIGLNTKAKKDVTIFSDKNEKNSVASIPKGYELQVILGDDTNHYLVKTTFGLTGWAKDGCKNESFEGISFKGD